MGDKGECEERAVTWIFGGRAYVLVDNKDLQELWRSESLKWERNKGTK